MKSLIDGIIDSSFYGKESCRVCWILKEANNKGKSPLNLIEYLHRLPVNDRVPRRVALATAGINLACNSILELDSYSDNVKLQLLTIAWININKEGGGSSASYSKIKKAFELNEDVLFSQIQEATPEVIIFGGTFSFFWDSFVKQGCVMKKLEFTTEMLHPLCYLDTSKRYPFLFVEAYHPAYRGMKDAEYAMYISKAVHAWKAGEWKLIRQW